MEIALTHILMKNFIACIFEWLFTKNLESQAIYTLHALLLLFLVMHCNMEYLYTIYYHYQIWNLLIKMEFSMIFYLEIKPFKNTNLIMTLILKMTNKQKERILKHVYNIDIFKYPQVWHTISIFWGIKREELTWSKLKNVQYSKFSFLRVFFFFFNCRLLI